MIVKIVFDTNKIDEYDSGRIEIYDGIESASLSYDKESKEKIVTIHKRNGEHFYMVITDKTCYLMNDDGKTIERIVGRKKGDA